MFHYASLILKLASACSLTFSCNYMHFIDLGVNEDFANKWASQQRCLGNHCVHSKALTMLRTPKAGHYELINADSMLPVSVTLMKCFAI
jgi:hypothetical protein